MGPRQSRLPLNVHKDGSSIRARVSSVSFFERANGVQDLAQVRYTKARRASGNAEEQISHWIATIQYVYGEPSEPEAPALESTRLQDRRVSRRRKSLPLR